MSSYSSTASAYSNPNSNPTYSTMLASSQTDRIDLEAGLDMGPGMGAQGTETEVEGGIGQVENISLFIPYVYTSVTEDYIRHIFEDSTIGYVKHVDFVAKLDKWGRNYNCAYIHFDYWYDNSTSARFNERVLNPNKEARIVYDDPKFWVVLQNNTMKRNPADPKICVDLSTPAVPTFNKAEGIKQLKKLLSIPTTTTSISISTAAAAAVTTATPLVVSQIETTMNLVSTDYVLELEAEIACLMQKNCRLEDIVSLQYDHIFELDMEVRSLRDIEPVTGAINIIPDDQEESMMDN